jgi:hypothetical protein
VCCDCGGPAVTTLTTEPGVEGEAGWDSNSNRVRTMSFVPGEDQLASIARWRDAWTAQGLRVPMRLRSVARLP